MSDTHPAPYDRSAPTSTADRIKYVEAYILIGDMDAAGCHLGLIEAHDRMLPAVQAARIRLEKARDARR